MNKINTRRNETNNWREAYQAFTYDNRIWTTAYGATEVEAVENLKSKLRQSPQARTVLEQVEDHEEAFTK